VRTLVFEKSKWKERGGGGTLLTTELLGGEGSQREPKGDRCGRIRGQRGGAASVLKAKGTLEETTLSPGNKGQRET